MKMYCHTTFLVFLLISGVCTLPIYAGSSYDEHHTSLLHKNPKGLAFRIEVEKNTYYLGEVIPVTLTFKNSSTVSYEVWTGTYDRSGRINDIAFHVDGPENGFSDPLATYFSQGWFGGGLGNTKTLGQHSQTFDLNEWVRFDLPGDYRFYCTTSRVREKREDGKYVSLCSQMVKLRITVPSNDLIRDEMAAALRGLDSEDDKVRRKAARILRFLARRESIGQLVRLLGDEYLSMEAFFGIVGSRDWPHAKKALLEGIEHPDVVVNHSYIQALAHISIPPEEHVVTFGVEDPEASRKQSDRLREAKEAASEEVVELLAESVSKKRGRALAVACSVLLQRKREDEELRKLLASSFQHLSEGGQRGLLRNRWEQARCTEFEQVLERLLEASPKREQWNAAGIPSLAVLRYQEFQPEKARQIILKDIKRPRPLLAEKALTSLPDEILREMDDVFLTNLSRDGSDLFKLAPLIERYGSPAILPQVVRFYKRSEGAWARSIQESLLGYWIKHDREEGLAAVSRAAGLREHTRCYTSVLENVLGVYYGPDAEKIALSFLKDKDLDVVVNVVRLLRRKGTANAIDPLLARLSATDPDIDKPSSGGSFSQKSVYSEIVSCLLNRSHWEFDESQKLKLKKLLRSDSDRKRFAQRFGLDP